MHSHAAHSDAHAIRTTINSWIYTLANGDINQRRALTIGGSTLHVMREQPDGSFELQTTKRNQHHLSGNSNSPSATIVERYWNERVRVEDQRATFWAQYDSSVNDEHSHCGAELIHLAKIDGHWKLGDMHYTVQLTDCPESPHGSLSTYYPQLHLQIADAFIKAFYTFDPDQLNPFFFSAEGSAATLQFYQGWAEGGNYKVLNRGECVVDAPNTVSCPVTVEDDPMLALGIDFKVTDTFAFTFAGPLLTKVETSSNDLPIYYRAFEWVTKEMPEVMSGPCQGFFAGGPTPGACAQAMTEGYRQFAASNDFPEDH